MKKVNSEHMFSGNTILTNENCWKRMIMKRKSWKTNCFTGHSKQMKIRKRKHLNNIFSEKDTGRSTRSTNRTLVRSTTRTWVRVRYGLGRSTRSTKRTWTANTVNKTDLDGQHGQQIGLGPVNNLDSDSVNRSDMDLDGQHGQQNGRV